MKVSLSSKYFSSGFTLIELLTVITIIAVLMGLLFPAVYSVKNSAKKAQARSDTLQVVNAVKAFYTEYGRYPLVASVETTGKYEANNDELFNVLRVTPNLNGEQLALNPRKIVFIEVPAARGSGEKQKGGIASNRKFLDPWGNPYRIWIDFDYDNELDNPYDSGAGFDPINGGVIAFSLGKDGKGGSGDKNSGDSEDDVISWQ